MDIPVWGCLLVMSLVQHPQDVCILSQMQSLHLLSSAGTLLKRLDQYSRSRVPGTSKHRPQAPQLSASPALAAQPVDEDWAQVCLGAGAIRAALTACCTPCLMIMSAWSRIQLGNA